MSRKKNRIENDSLGKIAIPKNVLWGAQTQRAINNFPISGIKLHFHLVGHLLWPLES